MHVGCNWLLQTLIARSGRVPIMNNRLLYAVHSSTGDDGVDINYCGRLNCKTHKYTSSGQRYDTTIDEDNRKERIRPTKIAGLGYVVDHGSSVPQDKPSHPF
ncbi:hypothetical protein PINS_up011617 [Pythium insidiosum]|nr:hypothetical protein PINS_up011617 [Pythium insidiosum]